MFAPQVRRRCLSDNRAIAFWRGRRTLVTKWAKASSKAKTKTDGSLRDVQQIAGHRSLYVTIRYLDGAAKATTKQRLVTMI